MDLPDVDVLTLGEVEALGGSREGGDGSVLCPQGGWLRRRQGWSGTMGGDSEIASRALPSSLSIFYGLFWVLFGGRF